MALPTFKGGVAIVFGLKRKILCYYRRLGYSKGCIRYEGNSITKFMYEILTHASDSVSLFRPKVFFYDDKFMTNL
jgi:hypothetical protein